MDGKSIYSKYLTMKMLLKFPMGRNFRPLDIYWYKVWVSPSALAFNVVDDSSRVSALSQ
jgi:hypothetical protein